MKRLWIAIAASLLLTAAAASADPLPTNQLPMYGGRAKTEAMKSADADFIASMEKQGLSRAEGARQMLKLGWTAWAKRDMATAMARFNQAWLLDPENGNVYHGFALVGAVRGDAPSDVEPLFRLATSKRRVDAEAFVDYGYFLASESRLDASLLQLNKALEVSATARNARSNIAFVYYLKNDFASSCVWVQRAAANGDRMEAAFPEDICARADKPLDRKASDGASPPA